MTEVRILKPADPAIDPQIPVVIGRWRYRPYSINGRPLSFCYFVKYEIVVSHGSTRDGSAPEDALVR